MSQSVLSRRRPPRGRRRLLARAATLGAGLVAAPPASADDFYTPPADTSGAPGTVLRSEPSVFYLDPLKALRAPADVTRVMYTSANGSGQIGRASCRERVLSSV